MHKSPRHLIYIEESKELGEETKDHHKQIIKRKKPQNFRINLIRCRGELELLKLIIEQNADNGWKVEDS